MDFETIPDGWHEARYELGPRRRDEPYTEELDAFWTDENGVLIDVGHYIGGRSQAYEIVVEQKIGCDGTTDWFQTDAHAVEDRRAVESVVVDIMSEFDDGERRIECIDVSGPDENGFVQFFTIDSGQFPEETSATEVVESIGAADDSIDDPSEHDVVDPFELDDGTLQSQAIQVAILPRHSAVIDGEQTWRDKIETNDDT